MKTTTPTKLGLALAGGLALLATPVHAAFVFTLQEVGSDVVSTGSGTINTAALSFFGNASFGAVLNSSNASIVGSASGSADFFTGISGPANFGSGIQTFANSSSGDIAGRYGAAIVVPLAYVSGTALANTATWTNQTFSSLGITPGTYTWTWGAGPTADSLVLNAAPEPTSAALLLGSSALLLLRRRRPAVR
jgi:hypothetical protein